MDRQSIYTASVFPEQPEANEDSSYRKILQKLTSFILEFHVDNTFKYR